MSYTEHPKSHGAMFVNNDKQGPNHPDLRGNVEVSPEQIKRLVEMVKAGLEPKLQVAGWWKQPKGGGATYLSMQAEAYMKEEVSQPPQYPTQQAPAQPVQQQAPNVPPMPQSTAPQPAADQGFEDIDIPF